MPSSKPSEADLKHAATQMALQWTLRKLYSGNGGVTFAPKAVDNSGLDEATKAVLHEQIDLLHG